MKEIIDSILIPLLDDIRDKLHHAFWMRCYRRPTKSELDDLIQDLYLRVATDASTCLPALLSVSGSKRSELLWTGINAVVRQKIPRLDRAGG